MQTFLTLVTNVMIAYACSRYAMRVRRNPTNWFIAGLLFGIFAIIVLYFLSRTRVAVVKPAPQPRIVPQLITLEPAHAEKLWYFLDEQMTQFGPMSFNGLKRAWNEGKVRDQTYVWNEEMKNWKKFQEVIRLS